MQLLSRSTFARKISEIYKSHDHYMEEEFSMSRLSCEFAFLATVARNDLYSFETIQ